MSPDAMGGPGDDRRDVCPDCRQPWTVCRCPQPVVGGVTRGGFQTSDSLAQIGAALAKAQGLIENASKDSKNPHFQSRYADLASVVDACRPALSAHGIAVIQIPSVYDAHLVRMRTLLLHASGEWILSPELQVQAAGAGPQPIGSCLTYLRRYQLAALVGVAPADDDDAEAAHGRVEGEARPKPAPRPGPPMKPPPPPRPGPRPGPPPPTAAKGRPEPPPPTDADIPF